MAFPTIDYNLSNTRELPSPLGYQAVQLVHLEKALGTGLLTSGAVIAIAKMPAGTRYVDLYAKSTDLDTDGTPAVALDLGIAGIGATTYDDVDCFLDGSAIGQAATGTETMLAAGLGLVVPIDHYLTLTVATAPDVAAAGTVTVGMRVVFP